MGAIWDRVLNRLFKCRMSKQRRRGLPEVQGRDHRQEVRIHHRPPCWEIPPRPGSKEAKP